MKMTERQSILFSPHTTSAPRSCAKGISRRCRGRIYKKRRVMRQAANTWGVYIAEKFDMSSVIHRYLLNSEPGFSSRWQAGKRGDWQGQMPRCSRLASDCHSIQEDSTRSERPHEQKIAKRRANLILAQIAGSSAAVRCPRREIGERITAVGVGM